MSSPTGRVLAGLMRASLGRAVCVRKAAPMSGVNCMRLLALSSQTSAEAKDGDKEVDNEPIKFSTSKASYRTWKVERSMGSNYQRPRWHVVPISLVLISFLLWCALRSQTDIDVELEKHLFKSLPGLLPDEMDDKPQDK
ncbi:ubiquinol-cytochrome c reductase complex assembly factor 4 [Spinachia spinachia]